MSENEPSENSDAEIPPVSESVIKSIEGQHLVRISIRLKISYKRHIVPNLLILGPDRSFGILVTPFLAID